MNKMFFLIVSFCVTCLFPACGSGSDIALGGKLIKQEKPIDGNFSEIKITGALNVIITMGDKENIVVEADEQEMPYVEVKQIGNEIYLGRKNNLKGWKNSQVTVYVNAKNLKDIEISGASKLKMENKLIADKLDVEVTGASLLVMDVEVRDLETKISGSSKASLSGTAKINDVDLSGASKLDAYNLSVTDYDLELSGASSADVYCNGTMEVEISGASSLKYKGNPVMKKTEISGASSIKQSN